MVGPWFTTPWRVVPQSRGAVASRFWSPIPYHVLFPLATSRQGPDPSVPWFPDPTGLLCGPCRTSILVPGPIPSLIPCLYPTRPPATQWRGPTGPSSIQGPFCAPCAGRSYPIPFFHVLGAFSSACSCPGRLATCPKSWPPWPTFLHCASPQLAYLCIGTRAQRLQAPVAEQGRHYTYSH